MSPDRYWIGHCGQPAFRAITGRSKRLSLVVNLQ
jgi:hypothetical protein